MNFHTLNLIHAFLMCSSLGASQSHLDFFKSIRGARVDHFVVETNKLLIRLDKLLNPDAPTEPKRRKGNNKELLISED